MPQVDLETLVSACAGGGTDRKIACETLADGRVESDDKRDNDDSVDDYEKRVAPDLLPESFLISKDAEFDWFDRNAFLERKESGKGFNPNPNLNSSSNSSSQRFVKSKASIIGLPRTQKNNYVDSMRRSCSKPANIRLFPPRRAESMGKPVGEPSSPKVSCIGRVRSKRGRRKSSPEKLGKSRSVGGKEKTGFYSRLVSVFLSNRGKKPAEKIEKDSKTEQQTPSRKSVKETKNRQVPVSIEPLAEPPGLGGMKRFASGRKSESWGANEINAAVSDAFGTERR